MSVSYDFSGKRCLVTGATGGIGSEVTRQLIQSGATVFGTSTNQKKLDEFVASIDSTLFFGHVCNLSNKDNVSSLVDSCIDEIGGIDIVICNAGITKDTLAIRMSDADWRDVIDVNLTANFVINRDAGKFMLRQRYGRIINISSVVGCTGNIGQANYASSKAGLIGLTKCMALEFATRNITVNAIAPGFIDTEMTSKIPENIKTTLLSKIPMARYGLPSHIANACLFLASDEASYITGLTLHVNGGMFMD